ncbi:hypothetical protein G5714_010562 [Onychostoma macrolepis]|uniref:Uncharacterized protein n=1 Tax=Onychostoma macrolepis TaxID=369639 RepID=A0A7J6CQ69_9TELE|nr:hypothetical protein G5714_010562 [Onychostoma macrolepis]
MITRILRNEEAVKATLAQQKHKLVMLTAAEWDKLHKLQTLLEPCKEQCVTGQPGFTRTALDPSHPSTQTHGGHRFQSTVRPTQDTRIHSSLHNKRTLRGLYRAKLVT